MTDPTPATEAPFDTILRARLRDLITRAGSNPSSVARAVGWSESTLLRKLRLDPKGDYRRLDGADVDKVLAVLDCAPGDILGPVLLDGDLEALRWIDANTKRGLGPSLHGWPEPAPSDCSKPVDPTGARLLRLRHQGLVSVRNVGHDPHGPQHRRLTPEGQRALL